VLERGFPVVAKTYVAGDDPELVSIHRTPSSDRDHSG
jgi:hypothetical protein